LQKDWEGVELFEALNRALLGERILGVTYIEWWRQRTGSQKARI
jgi:hypothetical protein